MSKGCAFVGGDDGPVAVLGDRSVFPSCSNRVAFRIAHVFGVPLGDVFQYPDHRGVTK
jgi:hypothetical protein